MTACIPDDPAYCFAPMCDEGGEPPQVHILVEGLGFAIPTALVALDREQGFVVCDRLNRTLGRSDRAAWTAFAARCLRAGAGGTNGSTVH